MAGPQPRFAMTSPAVRAEMQSPGRPRAEQQPHRREYKRTYKACDSCKRKKSRCILDDAGDSVAGGPCRRCRRELRDCTFTFDRGAPGRRSIRHAAPVTVITAITAREHRDETDEHAGPGLVIPPSAVPPSTIIVSGAGTSVVSDALPEHDSRRVAEQGRGPLNSPLPASFMRTAVSNESEALGLLYRAAEHADGQSTAQLAPLTGPSPHGGLLEASDLTSSATHMAGAGLAQPREDILQLWESVRFVRQGWFTAREAVTYLDLFFRNIAPLSPVLDDLYSRHENHFSLVSNEPLLCCTILMISSRYHDLTGPGSASRSILVHQRLWEHCLYLVNRILFGQEQRSNASLRTIGTIQALLLMVEWKPRAIHFPSTADGWDLHLVVPSNTQDQAAANPPDQALQKWLSNVTEPAKSADYVSWMLLGCASSLAHHLGLCSDGDSDSGRPRTADADMSALRLRKVLYILLELLSLRLGCEPAITATLSQSLSGASLPSRALRDLDSDHRAVNAWLELTSLTRSMSDVLFASPHVTRNIILGGRYVGIIKHFQQQLTKWRDSFADGQALPSNFGETLEIEFQYTCILLNSVGMQAVVSRIPADRAGRHVVHKEVQLSITPADHELIQRVVDGSCRILRLVDVLGRSGSLRYCPVRITLRVIAASIFLLKALSLGPRASPLETSLDLLERAIVVLAGSAADDTHLSARYAGLLEVHLARFRSGIPAAEAPPSDAVSVVGSSGGGGGGSGGGGGLGAQQLGQGEPGRDHTEAGGGGGGGGVPGVMADWLYPPWDPAAAFFGLAGENPYPLDMDDATFDFLWNLPTG